MGYPSLAFIILKVGEAMRVNGAIFENNVPFYLMSLIAYNEQYHVTFYAAILINHKRNIIISFSPSVWDLFILITVFFPLRFK